jgi:WD40 repeat protein
MITSAFSPSGRVIAVSDVDGTTSLWSTAPSHSQIAVLHEPGGAAVYSAEFEPHGTRLVTADSDGNAVIWSSAHRIVHVLPNGSADGLASAVFSPDGRWIVTGGSDGVRVWNADTFTLARKIHPGHKLRWAAVSPNSRLVVTAGQDATVSIWDLSTGSQRYATITEPDQQTITAVWFSPSDLRLDGHFYPRDTVIVTSSADGTARIWDALTGAELRTVTEPGRSAIYNAVLSPDGRWLLTASQDGTGRIWDVASGTLLTTFYAGNSVSDIELSPHGDLVGMALSWGEARIFSTALAGPDSVLLAYERAHMTRQLTPAEIREYASGS